MSGGDPAPTAAARARLRRALWILPVVVACSWVRAEGPLPLTLDRAVGEATTTLRPGPAALHVVFFATWCPPCVAELRALADLESRWAARGYRLVVIAVPTRQSRERIARFLEDGHPPGDWLLDPTGEAVRAFGVEGLPAHRVLDSRGEVVLRADRVAGEVAATVERLVGVRRRAAEEPR